MRYSVIAIEREYTSGGREIGDKLAEKVEIPCYGEEILEIAAVKLDMPLKRLREVEESITGDVIFGLAAYANLTSGQEMELLKIEQRLAIAESEIIRGLSVNSCVLIGRGAAALLNNNKRMLRVFIHADYRSKRQRV